MRTDGADCKDCGKWFLFADSDTTPATCPLCGGGAVFPFPAPPRGQAGPAGWKIKAYWSKGWEG